jgi:RNA polymerase sigma-70 factor, ECF subfamily
VTRPRTHGRRNTEPRIRQPDLRHPRQAHPGLAEDRPGSPGLTAADLVGARRREPAAVSRLYTAYAPTLFRFFVAAVGDRHIAEDLTGQVFTRAIEGLPDFRGPVEALGSWLLLIACHNLPDYRREAGNPVLPMGDPVLGALIRLPTDQREVLLLRVASGLTAPEVAAIVNKTTKAVKELQYRGLASLARVVGAKTDASFER